MQGSAQTLKKALQCTDYLMHTYSDNPLTRYGKTSIIIKAKYDSAKDKENYNENTKAQNWIQTICYAWQLSTVWKSWLYVYQRTATDMDGRVGVFRPYL